MENREISKVLSTTAKLMELHGENDFKIRSVQNAAFAIGRMEIPLKNLSPQLLENVRGIGKSISKKVLQLIDTGTFPELETYVEKTPAGVIEMMNIKGVGPKKTGVLWKELGVESPGELLYACNENRLIALKGFGSKTQEAISNSIEFAISQKGFFLYATLESFANRLVDSLLNLNSVLYAGLTGEIRRKNEILSSIDIVIAVSNDFKSDQFLSIPELSDARLTANDSGYVLLTTAGLKIIIHVTDENNFYNSLFFTTASKEHLLKLELLNGFDEIKNNFYKSEIEIFEHLGLSFIEPELREGNNEITLAQNNSLPELIILSDLKGILHNHSTYSDGLNSLEEMALHCKLMGYEYLGICDHSKSAFYANGLSEERVLQQQEEIDKLNKELFPFRIFKGIESDILSDGSLDYSVEFLAKFEFIVASVHSNLKMNEEKATERILKAVANKHTTILGHPTGRLLLARKGYPINHKAVIDACAEHGVVIELNAHPRRLDLDWRWIQYALEKNVMISINPDAHHLDGYKDMYFGTCVARKGMLTKKMTFNALSKEEVEKWFNHRRKAL